MLDECDKKEENNRKAKKYTRKELEKRLDIIEQKSKKLDGIAILVEEADGDVSITDADARKMKHLNGANEISHNVQIAVDDKNHMVVAVDVTSEAIDYGQFNNISGQAKKNLGVETLTAIADKGYFSAEELAKAEQKYFIQRSK